MYLMSSPQFTFVSSQRDSTLAMTTWPAGSEARLNPATVCHSEYEVTMPNGPLLSGVLSTAIPAPLDAAPPMVAINGASNPLLKPA